jgi:hypothetical protein
MAYHAIILAAGIAMCAYWISRTGNRRWLASYAAASPSRRRVSMDEPVHLLLCVADHFEPEWGSATTDQALFRVEHWVRQYPISFERFRDADGHPPRHTFFYPMESYDPQQVEMLASLCRRGFGEVEIHLHHGNDTGKTLHDKLESYVKRLAEQHNLLGFDSGTGRSAYAFAHGNWALNNALGDSRLCGVDHELEVLAATGCFADFTFPAFPSAAQPAKTNSIYYADFSKGRAALDCGIDARAGVTPPEHALMLIQGPLVLDWTRKKFGIFPRVENGCIQSNQVAQIGRLPQWLKARVQVRGRNDWFFVKLHTHGAQEQNFDALLGPAMIRFHDELAKFSLENPNFQIHYVTAREMWNLARAAEAGWPGSINEARDFAVISRSERNGPPGTNTHNRYGVSVLT